MIFPLSILALMSFSNVSAPQVYFSAPAKDQVAVVQAGGTTILPNGRFLTPQGKRLWAYDDVWQVLLHPNQKTVVIFCSGGLVIYDDVNAEKPEKRIVKLDVAPAGAFTPDGENLWVSTGESGDIQEVHLADGKLGEKIEANVDGVKDSYVNDLVLTKDGALAYAVDVANQDLLVFNLKALKLVKRIKAGREPYALSMTQDEKKLFVANIGLFDYSVIPTVRPGEGDPRGLTRPPFAFPSKESETGLDFEGRFVKGLGSPYVPDAQSIYAYDATEKESPRLVKQVKSGLLIHAPADSGKAVGGSAPNALLEKNGKLYVSNANSDSVQAFDSKSLKLLKTIKLSPSKIVARLRGVIPSGMAVNSKGTRLYVCESGLNAVAVIDTEKGQVLGHIPTGWFPVQVRISADDRTLFIATQKGLGRGPRGYLNKRDEKDERYGLSDMPGMVDAVAIPDDAKLNSWTHRVLENNGIVNRFDPQVHLKPSVVPFLHGVPSKEIKYVVFITKENHTYDGIFGGLEGTNGEPEYAEFGMRGWIAEKGKQDRMPIMPNHIRLAEQFGINDNFYMEPQASGDGHRWLVGVYPSLWTTRLFYAGWDFKLNDAAKGRLVPFGSNASQIPEDYLENGSLWEHLGRGGIPFRNYGEGFEFPGVDEPGDSTRSGAILHVNHPVSKVLWDNTCWEYPIFNNDIPDIARADWFVDDLEKNYRKKGKPIPRYINITICNDHGARPRPKEGYPYVCSYMADNDLALGRIVEYLTHLPEWKNMAILVTQDDSGGDSDHVDRHRSYVLAISPWAKRHYVSHDHTSIMSCLKTIYKMFGLGPNNMFDALATDLADMFTDKPDYTPYSHVISNPLVFVAEKAYNPKDPSYKKRRFAKPTVKMDDPEFVEWLRKQSARAMGDKDDKD